MSASSFKPVLLSTNELTPRLAVEILPQGVTVHRIYIQADGRTHDIIIGPEDPADYGTPAHKYKNTIIGRYTNRIPVGTFPLTHAADSSYTSSLTTILNEGAANSLHGGPDGFDGKAFETLSSSDDALLFSEAEKEILKKGPVQSHALFRHTSPDGDQGFPGELLIETLVGLCSASAEQVRGPLEETDCGTLFIVYRASVKSPKGEKVVTPINITQHWGFNLDASLRASDRPSIKNHHLEIASDNILELNDTFIATGNLAPVKGTPHEHLATSTKLGDRYPEKGYDDFYLFSPVPQPSRIAPGRVPLSSLKKSDFDLLTSIISNNEANPPSVVLSSPASGIKASFETNQGGVQFWSCEPLTGDGAIKRIHGGTGQSDGNKLGYRGAGGAFLEFHELHAAFLHKDLVDKSISKNDTLLKSDELYHNFIKIDIRFKTPTQV